MKPRVKPERIQCQRAGMQQPPAPAVPSPLPAQASATVALRAASTPMDIDSRTTNAAMPTQDTMQEPSSDDADTSNNGTDSSTNAALSSETAASTPTLNGGDADIVSAMHILGAESRQMIQTIQKLEALNIDSTLKSLPKFIVVGDQSAGKSSIIEATCAITLPRDEGTCTRCPYQITTTAAKPGQAWSCKVSLHCKYAYSPTTIATSDHEFDRWKVQKTPDIFEFAVVTHKQDLNDTLRRAQCALLNPDQDPISFTKSQRPYMDVENRVEDFCPNFVSLEIASAGLPELSLLDLPGAINIMAEEEKQYLVAFVEKLLSNYIQDQEALILLACAANADIETATAFRFVRKYQASGRCLGVLTKPDLLESGPKKIEDIKKMLDRHGNRFRLGHGWFVTRQLSQNEVDNHVSYDEARGREAVFFANTAPWNTALVDYNDQFGIPNLQIALSRELSNHIRHSLPSIAGRVQNRMTEVERQLSTFPNRATDPSNAVLMAIRDLENALVKQVSAYVEKTDFRDKYRNIFRRLLNDFDRYKPVAKLSTPGYKQPSFLVGSSDDEQMDVDTPSKTRKTTTAGRTFDRTPSSTPRTVGRKQPISTQKPKSGPAQLIASFARKNNVFTLDEVKKRYDSGSSADLGNQVNDKVDRQLMKETLQGWSPLVDKAFGELRQLFSDILRTTIGDALVKHKGCLLVTEATQILQMLYNDLLDNQSRVLSRIVASYCHRPISYSRDYPDKLEEFARKLVAERNEKRLREHYDTLEAEGVKVPKPTDWKIQDISADEYSREVTTLAKVQAFYDIASQQLVDTIARSCESDLMDAFENRIYESLVLGLQPGKEDHCVMLLAEDPARERLRVELLEEKTKLAQALAELESL